jgi:hypothetical protein
MVVPLMFNGNQVNVVAPKAVNETLLPAQIVLAGEAFTVIVGDGLTTTIAVWVPIQPIALVPLTVNILVAVGVTTVEDPVKPLGNQVNVLAPLTVNVLASPAHIIPGVTVTLNTGLGTTNTGTTAVLVQPPLLPVTVKEVVVLGVTTTVDPDIFPGFHVKLAAPAAVKVTLFPIQTGVGDAEAIIVGVGITNNVWVVEFLQPNTLAPNTVNMVVLDGLTVTVAPLRLPGIQVNVAAPEAVKVAVLPLQIRVGEAEVVSVGKGLTVNVNVVLLLHPVALVPVTV